MIAIISLLLLSAATVLNASPVVYGTDVRTAKYPFLVHLQISETPAIKDEDGDELADNCGGTLIGLRTVLTAAHCLDTVGTATIVVTAGVFHLDAKGVSQTTRLYKKHEQYQPLIEADPSKGIEKQPVKNDIAIVWVPEKFKITANVKLASIPTSDPTREYKFTEKTLMFMGWGSSEARRDEDQLKEGPAKAITMQKCVKDHKITKNENLICVEKPTTATPCFGDSGGPLVYNNNPIGVASSIIAVVVKPITTTTTKPKPGDKTTKPTKPTTTTTTEQPAEISCQSKKVTTFTNIYRYAAWIRSNMEPPKQSKGILPRGDVSLINLSGLNYYNDVINKLLRNGIEPIVTMYHFDLPEELQKIGGFANSLLIKYFKSYAEVLFRHFGDRVKTWITINEPYNFCVLGYGSDIFPPRVNASGIGEYLCMHHILKAHALVYKMYKTKYYKEQRGRVGITLSSRYFYSKSNDKDLEERAMQFMLGWAANPIFGKEGGYPDIMVNDIERNSLNEGRTCSRLPSLDSKWKETIKGASDFLGLNYYTARLVERNKPASNLTPSIAHDSEAYLTVHESWEHAKSKWLFYVPDGLEQLLKWIKQKYGNVEVIITENGWSDDGQYDDKKRVRYLTGHLRAVLNAINSGCNVTGYTYWSLIDNFEWRQGYTEKFGLYSVDLRSDKKQRTPKKSAKVYASIIKSRRIPKTHL